MSACFFNLTLCSCSFRGSTTEKSFFYQICKWLKRHYLSPQNHCEITNLEPEVLTITCQQVSSSSSLKITLITWKDEGQSASTVSSYKDARMNICRDLPRSSRLFNTVTRPMASLHCFTLNKNGNLFDTIGFLI